jgi:hypothetical protein
MSANADAITTIGRSLRTVSSLLLKMRDFRTIFALSYFRHGRASHRRIFTGIDGMVTLSEEEVCGSALPIQPGAGARRKRGASASQVIPM